MGIQQIDVSTGGRYDTTLGLRLSKSDSATGAHLFALEENKGPPIAENLWTISSYVADNILMSGSDVDYTLTVGKRTAALKFFKIDGQPFKIDASDKHTLGDERHLDHFWSVDHYDVEYRGSDPIIPTKSRNYNLLRHPDPISIFTVPTADPAAKDGVFHCIPDYYDLASARGRYEYILADTTKVIAGMKTSAPEMLAHAVEKFSGTKTAEWLQYTTMLQPRELGIWHLTDDKKAVTLGPGHVAHIQLIRELDIPFFPIAVEKAWGKDYLRQVRALVGYGESNAGLRALMRPENANKATNDL